MSEDDKSKIALFEIDEVPELTLSTIFEFGEETIVKTEKENDTDQNNKEHFNGSDNETSEKKSTSTNNNRLRVKREKERLRYNEMKKSDVKRYAQFLQARRIYDRNKRKAKRDLKSNVLQLNTEIRNDDSIVTYSNRNKRQASDRRSDTKYRRARIRKILEEEKGTASEINEEDIDERLRVKREKERLRYNEMKKSDVKKYAQFLQGRRIYKRNKRKAEQRDLKSKVLQLNTEIRNDDSIVTYSNRNKRQASDREPTNFKIKKIENDTDKYLPVFSTPEDDLANATIHSLHCASGFKYVAKLGKKQGGLLHIIKNPIWELCFQMPCQIPSCEAKLTGYRCKVISPQNIHCREFIYMHSEPNTDYVLLYKTTTDHIHEKNRECQEFLNNVSEYSKFDIDIYQMRKLLEYENNDLSTNESCNPVGNIKMPAESSNGFEYNNYEPKTVDQKPHDPTIRLKFQWFLKEECLSGQWILYRKFLNREELEDFIEFDGEWGLFSQTIVTGKFHQTEQEVYKCTAARFDDNSCKAQLKICCTLDGDYLLAFKSYTGHTCSLLRLQYPEFFHISKLTIDKRSLSYKMNAYFKSEMKQLDEIGFTVEDMKAYFDQHSPYNISMNSLYIYASRIPRFNESARKKNYYQRLNNKNYRQTRILPDDYNACKLYKTINTVENHLKRQNTWQHLSSDYDIDDGFMHIFRCKENSCGKRIYLKFDGFQKCVFWHISKAHHAHYGSMVYEQDSGVKEVETAGKLIAEDSEEEDMELMDVIDEDDVGSGKEENISIAKELVIKEEIIDLDSDVEVIVDS